MGILGKSAARALKPSYYCDPPCSEKLCICPDCAKENVCKFSEQYRAYRLKLIEDIPEDLTDLVSVQIKCSQFLKSSDSKETK